MAISGMLWRGAIVITVLCANLSAQSAPPTGIFDGSSDVGTVLQPGSVNYDAAKHSYSVSSSGENMWFASDAFHFVWKKVSGDATLTADIAFPVKGGNAHRKAVLMIRQNLDADSAYADAALHGDGLTSLQARMEKGSVTHEVQANGSAPSRLRIVRRGEQIYIFLAGEKQPLRFAGGSMRLALQGSYYIGIGVCSHDKDAVETAVFSNIELVAGTSAPPIQARLFSTLETVTVASTDARAVYVTPGRIEAPVWLRDGSCLLFNRGGRMERVPSTGGQPQSIDTQSATHSDSHHAISSDGQSLAFGDDSQQHGKTAIYVVPAAGGTPRRVTMQVPSWGPAWSPDGKTLAFTGERNGQVAIYSVPAAGGEETRLTNGEGRSEAPDYSPNGEYIYFNSSRSGSRQIWRMRPDGSEQQAVTDDNFNNIYPHVSPDGTRMVFLSYDKQLDIPQDCEVQLRTMNLAESLGGNKSVFLAAFTGGLGSIDAPSWSPDSKRLAFVSYQMTP